MFRIMELPSFLAFTPVPVRAQHNGWSPELQRHFILRLARGEGPDSAARALGRSRQSVYRLRSRPDAASFATAWDGAVAFSQRIGRVRQQAPLGLGTIETLLVPRFYRGRLIGFVQREDVAGAMRALRRLDRVNDRLEAERSPSRTARSRRGK
jgi:hypothetical protein